MSTVEMSRDEQEKYQIEGTGLEGAPKCPFCGEEEIPYEMDESYEGGTQVCGFCECTYTYEMAVYWTTEPVKASETWAKERLEYLRESGMI